MLYWPTERGLPYVVEDVIPLPIERTVYDDAWLEETVGGIDKEYMWHMQDITQDHCQRVTQLTIHRDMEIDGAWALYQRAQDVRYELYWRGQDAPVQ